MASSPPALYFLYYEKVQSGRALKIPGGHMPTQNTPSCDYAASGLVNPVKSSSLSSPKLRLLRMFFLTGKSP